MKRTILLTMLALSLTLGSSNVYAGSCNHCRNMSAEPSAWQNVELVLSSLFDGFLVFV